MKKLILLALGGYVWRKFSQKSAGRWLGSPSSASKAHGSDGYRGAVQ